MNWTMVAAIQFLLSNGEAGLVVGLGFLAAGRVVQRKHHIGVSRTQPSRSERTVIERPGAGHPLILPEVVNCTEPSSLAAILKGACDGCQFARGKQ
jgi:hypothetical protein